MNISRRTMLWRTTGLGLAWGLFPGTLVRAQTTARAATGEDTLVPANPYADAVFRDGPPPLPDPGAFTIAVLPDTQHYRNANVGTFRKQTDWVVAHAGERRIAAVLHLGDLTNNNWPEQWDVARDAMGVLDGHVPYFMVPGNHDYYTKRTPDDKVGQAMDRTCGMTGAFPVAKFKGLPTFGGVYHREPDRIENSYHLLSAGGRELLVLCLEFGPRAEVVRWANEVVARHARREVILVTHGFTYCDDTRYDWKRYGKAQKWNPHSYPIATRANHDVMDGQELWDALVSRHGNFLFTISGHVLDDGLGRMTSTTPGGREVPQTLVNFQMRPNGGDGWLRLLEFKPDGRTIDVRDYSPTLNRQNISPQNRFAMVTSPIARS